MNVSIYIAAKPDDLKVHKTASIEGHFSCDECNYAATIARDLKRHQGKQTWKYYIM